MLTKDLVLDLWSKTYNTEGKPDWSHILRYYDNEIYFRDSIQEIRGIEEFTAIPKVNPIGHTFFPITIMRYISGIPFRKYVESKNLQQ